MYETTSRLSECHASVEDAGRRVKAQQNLVNYLTRMMPLGG